MKEELHFGHLIKDLLKSEGRSVSWFAERMKCDRRNMYKILERSYLDSNFIIRASEILDHDFFDDASKWFQDNRNNRTAGDG